MNGNGKITAVGAGETKVTASCGSVSASCIVTVKARAATKYRIERIVLRDGSGAELSAIPRGAFLATVYVTKLADSGDTTVCLATYSAEGQYRGLFYAGMENLPAGTTFRFTFPIDNSDGKIGALKAFPIASFADLTPLGEAVSFPS